MSDTPSGRRGEKQVTDRSPSTARLASYPGRSYGSTGTGAPTNAHGRAVSRPAGEEEGYPTHAVHRTKRRQQQQQQQQQHLEEEPGLVRRAAGGIGVLLLFAVGVTTASYRGLSTAQLNDAAAVPTAFGRAIHDASEVATLSVTATNEYGVYSKHALALYGLQMLVEPRRQTTLTTTSSLAGADGAGDTAEGSTPSEAAGSVFAWRVVELDFDDDGNAFELPGREAAFEGEGPDDHVTVELERAGGVYRLTVEERVGASSSGSHGLANLAADTRGWRGVAGEGSYEVFVVVARSTITINCKHVRRELRQLTAADRKDFLDAMEVYYTISTEDGKAKYGTDFFNYELLTAYHNSDLNKFCYHAGLQFLTAHAAFGLMMERSLQTINPKVSLAFWDYMIEAETVGTGWLESTIFDENMFGRAMGSADDGYQVTEGRFGGIRTIYDPDYTLLDTGISIGYHYNAYGFLSPTYNYQELPLMTRASSFCNLKAHAVFATSNVLLACFSEHDNLSDWELCMEKKVHGDMHGLLGGAFNCNVDMNEFHLQHPEFSKGLLTFILEYLTSKYWPNNNFSPDLNECDTECELGQPCGCTCTIDALTIPEDQVYSMTDDFMFAATKRYGGDKFVSYDETHDRPWGFMQDGERLGDDATMLLLRHVVKIGCEPAAVGTMVGGTSPMDPIFWVLHPLFEKALHVLWMSPQFRDTFDFRWVDGACTGSKIDDRVPFTEKNLGMGSETDLLTNRDLMKYLHASNPRLPYVYEDFGTWGASSGWDFCPECTAT